MEGKISVQMISRGYKLEIYRKLKYRSRNEGVAMQITIITSTEIG
jgi:hypothetical protein